MSEADSSNGGSGCVLLFSGGRDSTIAAVRLDRIFSSLVLLTVTSNHLIGLERVRRRIVELRAHLSARTEWVHAVTKQSGLALDGTEIESCLPCHAIYFLAAVHIADQRQIGYIAAGYTKYQSAWLEQTPMALDRLRSVMANVGKTLLLPAQDVASKDEAKSILRSHGLSDVALEQKCLKQQFNSSDVQPDSARKEIDSWARNLERLLAVTRAPDFVDVKGSLTIEEVTS